MRFSDIKGNEDVKRALVSMADSGRIPHSTLFYENEGGGAFPLVMAFLQYLACQNKHDGDSCGECPSCVKMSKLIHPDTHFVYPTNTGSKTGKMAAKDVTSEIYAKEFRELALSNPYFLEADMSAAFGIESKVCDVNVQEAKYIIDKLSLSAVENGYKAVVFFQPEKMNVQTANKLLKIVEEPPEKTLFLFITHNPEKVLQTIFSRCQCLRVVPPPRSELANLRSSADTQSYMDLFADLMKAVTDRDLLAALECADDLAAFDSREKQKAFLVYASEGFRKIFMIQQNLSQIAYLSEYEQDLFTNLASKCPKPYSRKAMDYLNSAAALLERNVNQKILFCDLVNRLFISL